MFRPGSEAEEISESILQGLERFFDRYIFAIDEGDREDVAAAFRAEAKRLELAQ